MDLKSYIEYPGCCNYTESSPKSGKNREIYFVSGKHEISNNTIKEIVSGGWRPLLLLAFCIYLIGEILFLLGTREFGNFAK